MEFLLPHDWLDATKDNFLKSDDDFQMAMHGLRAKAGINFGGVVQSALHRYAEANSGQFPTDLSKLEPFFKSPTESALLQRYEIIPAIYLGGDGSIGDWAITQKAPVDEQADLRIAIGTGVIVQGWRMDTDRALDSLISAFAAVNGGRLPKSLHDLKPFVSTPEEQAALKKSMTADRNRPGPAAVPINRGAFPHQYRYGSSFPVVRQK
jgi:hypothetical protein